MQPYSARLLIVDDDPIHCNICCAVLADDWDHVDWEESGELALERLRAAARLRQPYHLVLLDWRMPGLDGFQLAYSIMADPLLAPRPALIMVTAHGREMVMVTADRMGLEGFLIKPVLPWLLREAVEVALMERAEVMGLATRFPKGQQAPPDIPA